MKVIALHTDFRIYWPARLKALSEALAERGDSLEVIEIAGKGSPYSFAQKNETGDSLKWHILFPDSKPEELSGQQIEPILFKLLDQIQPDVILSGAIAFPSGALAVRYGQKHGTKVIVFDDSKIEAVKRNPIVNFIKQAVYSGVDAMLYPAEDWMPTGEFWKFTEKRMFFGVDVVDNDFWSKPRNIENTIGKYFLAVGRQIPKKNFDKIVEAYGKYVACIGKNNAYKLVLIGEGPEHDNIQNKIEELSLKDLVILCPFKSQEELAGIYQNSQGLIVNSNLEETWGLVINEAMAAGCPIFASNQCGATNVLVKEGFTGYRFDCNDLQKLSECLIAYHNLSEEEKDKMKEASKSIISEWGLKRFANGVIDASSLVSSISKRKASFINKIIISNWKGQYKPI